VILLGATLGLLGATLVFGVRALEANSRKMTELEGQRRMDEDDYFYEIWMDHPDCDKPGYVGISFDGWWREKQAPRLPPAEIKPRGYR
jgi:hypothetical protein